MDSTKNNLGIKERRFLDVSSKENVYTPLPSNMKRDVKFDTKTKLYTIQKLIGGKLYSVPQYLTIEQYQRLMHREIISNNWRENSSTEVNQARANGVINVLTIENKIFEKIFGGTEINIQPRGQVEVSLLGRISRNESPLLNENQRVQGTFDFDERIQAELITSVGNNFKFNLKYSTEAQFDFENQVKLDFLGNLDNLSPAALAGALGQKASEKLSDKTGVQVSDGRSAAISSGNDKIIKRIEAGNISFPLKTSLITGSQSLFGLKTQLQFGKLNITSVISQQRSQASRLNLNNGAQQNEYKLSADAYETNRHYFLANFFRENYNKALATAPLIMSDVLVTKVEVWVTNKTGKTVDSRDVLAFLDLGENVPHNKAQVVGGTSIYPSAFSSPSFPAHSNNLLANLPAGARLANNNDVVSYFQPYGGGDNFAKLTYARKLTEKEFSFQSQLGYISLNYALNADEVLAVAYRYTYRGVEYQVGEFSTDLPFDENQPKVLFTKLLKNEIIKVSLPTWNLMMKNIYSLGGTQVSNKNFKLDIVRIDDQTGVERPVLLEGTKTSNKIWLGLTGLDRLNEQKEAKPDGIFDFETEKKAFAPNTSNNNNAQGGTNPSLNTFNTNSSNGYVTIDPINGRIIFPLLEPFGDDLAKQFDQVTEKNLIEKYTYKALYDSTRAVAQQLFADKNKFSINIRYQGESSSEISLNSINVPEGSVKVMSGNIPLQEGVDYTVDYQGGRVRIINPAVLTSGQPIAVSAENSETFGLQQRTLLGSRFDYKVNNKLNFGGTIMRLIERPISPKVNYSEEPLANTIFGFDFNYSAPSRFITKMVDKLPFLSTKAPSNVTLYGEYAQIIPGHPSAINSLGRKGGASYLDDFESFRSVIDLKLANPWRLSGTPNHFSESNLTDNLAYGFNRAKIAFYNVDPVFYDASSSLLPSSFRSNRNELSNHYVRYVLEKEVFPYKEIASGQSNIIPTLDIAYYPKQRGPYNFATNGFGSDGLFTNPKSKWGGLFRPILTNDFEALNIGYIEFFMMDPFIYKPNSQGGDLYFNLGNISEDILKDGRKSLENALPADGDINKYDNTTWGKVSKIQPVVQVFDNEPEARKKQDVGLDGLTNEEERIRFASNLNAIKALLNPDAAAALENDPASDDFQYFRGGSLDNNNAGILKRYFNYNNPDGNSKTAQQSLEDLGIESASSTPLPDGEDINRDNNMTISEAYYQYKISMRPADLMVGKNFITDKIVTEVRLENGQVSPVTWYQFRVPIEQYKEKVGSIDDFKSIRFFRMFLTDFADETVLRFARLQLIRGDWRVFNNKNEQKQLIVEPQILTPLPDKSSVEIGTASIEDNGKRTPIPYVLPPGISRELDFNNLNGAVNQNEQSLAVTFKNIRDGYGRAVFKTAIHDFKSYKRLEMYVHAESIGEFSIADNDVNAFLRVGVDNQDNYYEYEKPLKITQPGTSDPYSIWMEENKFDIDLTLFQDAKTARNSARTAQGFPWPINVPYTYVKGSSRITIKGQPDLGRVRIVTLGVKNPTEKGDDSFLDKSVLVWFNELRLTEFDEQGGWAATGRVNAKLADFGDLNFSLSRTTIGFGALEKRVSERSRADDLSIEVSSNMELGKFLPKKSNIKIPTYVNYSNKVSTPQFDPRSPDIELKNALSKTTGLARDSILNYTQDVTERKGYSFTNVHKERGPNDTKVKVWDVENFSATYAFTEFSHRDYVIESNSQRNYKAALMYNYSTEQTSFQPLRKLIKGNNLSFFKDFNYTLFPSTLTFGINVDRMYAQNVIRNSSPLDRNAPFFTINKNFLISRNYGLSWPISKSVTLDFDAVNSGVVDEPNGKIEGLKRDTVIRNLKNFGRTTDYRHTLNLTYNLPLNKISFLNWINVKTSYSANYSWQTEPLVTLRDPNVNLGNTIQNSSIVLVNPAFDFKNLYAKIPGLRKAINNPKPSLIGGFFVNLITSLKTVNVTYTKNRGIFLPGYMPRTNYFGIENDSGAPGFGFVFGSQEDIRLRAVQNNWLTTDLSQNQLYVNTFREDIGFNGILEPIKHLRVTLTANRGRNLNFSSNFKFDESLNDFTDLSPITTGDYNISINTFGTAFVDSNSSTVSELYRRFLENRAVISQRLGAQNVNSGGMVGAYADGYSKNSQNVTVASFLATFQGKNARTASLNLMPKIPLPNWRATYDGLRAIPILKDIFSELNLNHAFKSTFSVNGFNSLMKYQEKNGHVISRDVNQDFLPEYQFSQVTINEQFSPLIGVRTRFTNNISTNFEYNKTRLLGLSLSNQQLAQTTENNIVFGIGYTTNKFRFPFGWFSTLKLENNLSCKLDISVRDAKSVIFRAETEKAEVSSGAKNITFRPNIDYVVTKNINITLFYDSNITKPYTSQTYNTSFTNFGIRFKATFN
ncbi:MAG: cell surface protein SprA [Sphingobacteriaceae bacterium]|nr:cell surface protein SprA [Sphingobacteriaceae bacterium]